MLLLSVALLYHSYPYYAELRSARAVMDLRGPLALE